MAYELIRMLASSPGGDLAGLPLSVEVNFLRSAPDHQDWDVLRGQQLCADDLDAPDIEDTAVGKDVLLFEDLLLSGVDVEGGLTEPFLQDFDVALDVGFEDLRNDVLPEVSGEILVRKSGVHHLELAVHTGRFCFRKEPPTLLVTFLMMTIRGFSLSSHNLFFNDCMERPTAVFSLKSSTFLPKDSLDSMFVATTAVPASSLLLTALCLFPEARSFSRLSLLCSLVINPPYRELSPSSMTSETSL